MERYYKIINLIRIFLTNYGRWILEAIAIIILLLLFLKYNSAQNEKFSEVLKLNNAIHAEMITYKTKTGELVNEKLTLQTELKNLKLEKDNLTENQNKLLNNLENVKKERDIFAAANIKLQAELTNITSIGTVVNDTTVEFNSDADSKFLSYKFTITGVHNPLNSTILPQLTINYLYLPNEQFITFQWDKNRRSDYPVSFSVQNTSPYYKTYDIDSYAIPELQKQAIKPTFFYRIGNFGKTTGGKVLIFGAGVIVGNYLLN